MISRICILFIFVFLLTSAQLTKAQGGNATVTPPTVKKPATEPKKPAAVKPRSNTLSKTNSAKQTPKSNNSSRRKSSTQVSNRRKSVDRNDTENDKTGVQVIDFEKFFRENGKNVAFPSTNSVSGWWSGSWSNSKGEKGETTINIIEGANGVITGDEDGWTIENGRRAENVLTWEYRNQNGGCRDYKVRIEISIDGIAANGEFEVSDRCENLIYKGKYINYRKQ